MNVRELIEKLQEIENQELPVEFFYFDRDGNVYDAIETIELSTDNRGQSIVELRSW